jgi:hypothetical protein
MASAVTPMRLSISPVSSARVKHGRDYLSSSTATGNLPRLKRSPSLTFGPGTASLNFSAEKFSSGVRFSMSKLTQKATSIGGLLR